MTTIRGTNINFEREPLRHPFGFKGGSLTEIWQVVSRLEADSGQTAVGLGAQSVLWSDSSLFADFSEAGGNSLMFLMTEHALREARGMSFASPVELIRDLFPRVLEYGKKLTGRDGLRPTFALNALVGIDLAAWLLHARETGVTAFDGLIPDRFAGALDARQEKLSKIPLISYGTGMDEVGRLVDEGCFFLKIKVGADPAGDGDRDKMLEWDMARLTELHAHLARVPCPHTENGKVAYYLDGNGRYDTKDRLKRLIDRAEKIGALEQIHLLEEPFPEENEDDVSDIPLRVVADESAHTTEDAIRRMEQGYGAIALKPIAKTLSMSLEVALAARERDVPCFCADLTVTPLLVEWNRNFAARLQALPGLRTGVLETNGDQNYRNWETLLGYHPRGDRPWARGEAGFFPLDEEYYRTGGGIFDPAPHYEELVAR